MDKFQAIQTFWGSFGLPAYDENTVNNSAVMPYITYEAAIGNLDNSLTLSASLWYRSTSWAAISQKAEEIEKYLKEHGHITLKIDNGLLMIYASSPFAQRMNGDEDNVRRMILNIGCEFLTAY